MLTISDIYFINLKLMLIYHHDHSISILVNMYYVVFIMCYLGTEPNVVRIYYQSVNK